MKKNLFAYFVFFYVLVFIVLPPVFGGFFFERPNDFEAHYPFSVFFSAGVSLLIYVLSLKGRIIEKPFLRQKQPFFVYSSSILCCFGILCFSTAVLEIAAFLLKIDAGIHKIIFPDTLLGFLNFFLGVICAAFSEEVIYRFYLPHALKTVALKKFRNNPKQWLICEAAALLLFALGHVYLGVLGFFNALICGTALRICMVRTKSLWIPFAIHCVYNFLSFLFYFLASR